MKTLFLGSTGFVGSALLNTLEIKEDLVLLMRKPNKDNKHNQIIGDITDSETQKRIIDIGFERVVDCSWEGLPDLTELTNQKNLKSKLSLYKGLIHSGVQEINSIGSCLEYGSVKGLVSEKSIGIDVSDFGKVKLQILNELKDSNITFRWFRPFYLVGVNQHPKSLINTAIRSIQSGIDFTPRYPEKSFDYISIVDAVQGISLALNVKQCTGIINLGRGESRSVNEVVNLVRKHFGTAEKECLKEPAMISDSSKIATLTGWGPKVSIESEVSKIVLSRNDT